MGKDEDASKSLLENLRTIQMRQVVQQQPAGTDGKPIAVGSVEMVGVESIDYDDKIFNVGADLREEVIEYIPDFHRNFDYCLVFPLVIKIGFGYELTQQSVELMLKLKKLGAILFPYLSVQKDELFVLVRFPLSKLRSYAEKSKFIFPLDPTVVEDMAIAGNEDSKIAPILIDYRSSEDKYHPFLYMYGRYSTEIDEGLYWRPPETDNPFRPIVRIKLTKNIIQGPLRLGGGGLVLKKLIHDRTITAAFPLHESEQRKHILHFCIKPSTMPWNFPFAELNEYEIAIVFPSLNFPP